MMTKHVIEFVFPIPIFMFDMEYDEDDLIKKIYEYKENTDQEGVVKSNEGGYHSNYRTHEDPLFHDFTEELNNKIGSVIEQHTTRNGRITMRQFWFNINQPGSFNKKHTHPESHLSGVMWIKVPKKSGNLIFDNPNAHTHHVNIDVLNKRRFAEAQYHKALEYHAVEKKVILFPSDLLHHVEVNKSNEDRISCAFNITIKY